MVDIAAFLTYLPICEIRNLIWVPPMRRRSAGVKGGPRNKLYSFVRAFWKRDSIKILRTLEEV